MAVMRFYAKTMSEKTKQTLTWVVCLGFTFWRHAEAARDRAQEIAAVDEASEERLAPCLVAEVCINRWEFYHQEGSFVFRSCKRFFWFSLHLPV